MEKTRRIRREQETIRAMVRLYCRAHHSTRPPCTSCATLLEYALQRVDRCPWGENKGACSECSIHCFRSAERERVRRLMAWAGPRMLLRHPLLALLHLLDKRRRPRKEISAPRATQNS